MSDILPFVVVGLATGSVVSLAAMGLVLTYKTSGLFNFAHGAVAAAGAYVFYELWDQRGLPWPIAAVITLAVAGPLFGLGLELLSRRLGPLDTVPQVLGTIGLLLLIQSIAVQIYGPSVRNFPQFLPTSTFGVVGVRVGYDQLIVVILAAAAAAALFAFFRSSRLGIAMRGVVDDPNLLAMSGTNERQVQRTAWVIGTTFAALSGVLIAPTLGLDAFLLTLLVVQAFGAAAIGRFSSLPMTYAGALIVGVAAALVTRYTADFPSLSGLPPGLPFIVLFIVLIVRPPTEIRAKVASRRGSDRPRLELTREAKLGLGGVGLIGLVAVPHVVGVRLSVFTNGLTFAIVFLALSLLLWTSGQVSLGQLAFAAVGASSFSHFASGAGLPWLVALLLAGLVTVPVGALIAIPAVRLSGIYLALATLGFTLLLERFVYTTGLMFGATGNRPMPRPAFGSEGVGDEGYYYVVLAVLVVSVVVISLLLRSRLGRLLRALADSPVALRANGVDTTVALVLVFCISAFFTGIAGALIGSATGSVSGTGFGLFDSLFLVVVLAISGRSPITSAFIAAALHRVLPSYAPDFFVDNQTLLFGAIAVGASVLSAGTEGLRARMVTALRTAEWRSRRSPVAARFKEAG